MITMKVKKLDDKAILPKYHSEEAAGLDVYACLDEPITIEPGEIKSIPTKIAVEIPPGYEIQVRPRSGLAFKHGITVINSPGGNANIRFDLPHLSATMAGGFDSGLEGIMYASDHIKNGYGNSLLTAGLEEASVYQFLGSERDGYLSTTDEMKPFGKESNGFVLGEGVAVALLESQEHASQRGAKVLATIEGYASGFDAPGDGSVAEQVINLALENAGITASDISFIVSDANGLAKVDTLRLTAIKNSVGSQTPVTCYKTVFGETWGAAGMLDLAGALADMQEKRISPIQGSYVAMDGINLVREEQKLVSEYVLLTSLTSEGNCSAVVIKNS